MCTELSWLSLKENFKNLFRFDSGYAVCSSASIQGVQDKIIQQNIKKTRFLIFKKQLGYSETGNISTKHKIIFTEAKKPSAY